jgi:Ca-activated chloride channel homolog
MRLRSACGIAIVSVLAWNQSAHAQGFIVDRRPHVPVMRSFEVKEVSLDARIRDQVAEVQVSQTFHNPGSFQLESEYLFPLPEEGAVQNFVLLVDGRELTGRLLSKDEARRIYEEIVRTKRDPALLEYMGRGLYKTSVFPIPPGADRKVTMRYTQVCKRDHSVVEFAYPFATQKMTAKPIQRLNLTLRLESKDAIKSVYCPTYDARVDRTGDHDVRVNFDRRDTIPDADFRLIYTLADGAVGTSLLSYRPSSSEDGYFLLMASPEVKHADAKRQAKTVIFVLDRSGSMAGKKIEQARNALKFVLGNLREDDTFNIVVYDDRVETFKPELQRYSSRSREEAERFIANIREGGSTDIDAGLKTALAMIHDEDRPSYVLFLTDGLPTAGETRETAIAQRCRDANKDHARLFVFGVGYDVNARLLDRLSAGNSGTSEYVKPDEDIEAHVGRYYAKLTSPVLSKIRVELDGSDINRTYPRDIPDLFDGGQVLIAGRYRDSGRSRVRLTGKVSGETRTQEFSTDLARAGDNASYDFVEKIWATRRVGDLIDQIDLHGQSKELVDELVALSMKYGILTPYTSFLADETVPLHAASANFYRASESLQQLGEVSGFSGVNQRGMKQDLKLADRAATSGPATALGLRREDEAHQTPGLSTTGPRFARRMGDSYGLDARMMAGAGGMAAGGKPAQNATASNLRHVGKKTFYRKDNRWVDSSVKPEDEAKAVVIRQFSEEFFKLARSQKAEMNQYLAFDEPVTIELDGTVYRFESPAK